MMVSRSSLRIGIACFSSFGGSGVVATEIRTALYPGSGPKPPVLGFICGLGGREVYEADIEKMTAACFEAAVGKPQPLTQWIGVRE